MYEEVFINFCGKQTSILIHSNNSHQQDRIPCFVVGLSSHYHRKFSEKFLSCYQLVLLDLYWTDTSYSRDFIKNLSLASMSEHIEMVRQELEKIFGSRYQKIVLLGHSAFGFLCLEYSSRYASNLYGVINICSPLHFKESDLQSLQEEYLDSNFGHRAPNGPNQRWFDYYHYKSVHKNNESAYAKMSDKEKFVLWYLSMGPILWKERIWWQNTNNIAAEIWNPWLIPIEKSNQKEIFCTRRNVNMMVYSHYFDLAKEVDYRKILFDINTPILWYLGLFDARISPYHFELKGNNLKNSKIDIYYVRTGHWPMFEKGHEEFDNQAYKWSREIVEQEVKQDVINEQSIPRSKL